MAERSGAGGPRAPEDDAPPTALPVVSTSQFAEIARPIAAPAAPVAPRALERGAVIFDLDGTLLDSIGLISRVAGVVLAESFGTPEAEARVHYLATTGMPFEAQLAQLYPDVPAARRSEVARDFHAKKVTEAYARAEPFPEVPKLLKRLDAARWTLAVSTGAEREMADLLLEREGLRYWFEDVLGSGQGTKREHLREYQRRYPDVPLFLVGDSRFDMEAAASVPGVVSLARASRYDAWSLSPDDLRRWGASWADYSLAELPEQLERLTAAPPPSRRPAARPRRGRKGRDRESPAAGEGPAPV